MQDEMATIQASKLADLVLLDYNPLEHIRNTRSINAVLARSDLLTQGVRGGADDAPLHAGSHDARPRLRLAVSARTRENPRCQRMCGSARAGLSTVGRFGFYRTPAGQEV